PAVPDPEAQCITEQGAQGGAGQRIRPVDVAEPDQRADREQQRQRRHDDADHRQRIAEGDQEHQPAGSDRVRTDPGNGVVEPGARHPAIMPAGLQCRKRRTPCLTCPARPCSSPVPRAASAVRSRCAPRATAPTWRSSPSPTCPTRNCRARFTPSPPRPRPPAATVETFGGIDVLVNNASAIWLRGTLDTPMKRFDLMQQVNARGTFLCAQACLPHLLESANPHILTLAPPPSLDPKWWGPHTGYTLAKMGMSFVTIGLAAEFGRRGVAVNALWPRTVIATDAVNMLPGVDTA